MSLIGKPKEQRGHNHNTAVAAIFKSLANSKERLSDAEIVNLAKQIVLGSSTDVVPIGDVKRSDAL